MVGRLDTRVAPPPGSEPVRTPIKPEPSSASSPYHSRDRTMTPVKNEFRHESTRSPHPETEAVDAQSAAYWAAFDPRAAATMAAPSRNGPLHAQHPVSGMPRSSVGHTRGSSEQSSAATSVTLKRANSENGGYRVDDAASTPRSTPQAILANPRRGASFGSQDAGRPRWPTTPDADGFVRPTRHPPATSTTATTQMHPSMYANYASVGAGAPSAAAASPVNHLGAGTAGMMAPTYAHAQAIYAQQAGFVPLTLPPPGYATISQGSSSRDSTSTFAASPPTSLSSVEQQQQHPPPNAQQMGGASRAAMQAAVTDAALMDAAAYGTTSFSGYGITRSPFAMPAAFADWLFNEPPIDNAMPMGSQMMGSTGIFNFSGGLGAPLQSAWTPGDLGFEGFDPQLLSHQHPMAVTSILGPAPVESQLGEEKRQQLIDLMESRFNEPDQTPVSRKKADLLDGDRDAEGHVLSLPMMRIYIASYWYHFHPQLPILHRPTFVPDQAQSLLLIAMIAIGASCLPKAHGHGATNDAARLANFLASHLRFEIFLHAHFNPPAKLWVFQALLILEVYEKMYSTRLLHERAHVHHATTITLMRRGSSLIGKSALDSPPSVRDDRAGGGGGGGGGAGGGGGQTGASQTTSSSGATTPDHWWHEWITAEATRRAAFAAFVIDGMHAQLFGHSAVMVAHEMQLPLPHDEALWSAPSGAEVGRLEANLKANGFKRTSFLEGLKQTLNGKTVRTNAFGRTILMAGLLSVTWHMKQRDLQLNSLGVVVRDLGGRDRWRGSLTRAYDFWMKDFNDSLAEHPETSTNADAAAAAVAVPGSRRVQEDIIFESKNVLHHLAHMAMHVDIVDCQIYARAPRLLGRTIGPQDYAAAKTRMKEWANTAKARDATFYALRFLADVLCPAPGRGPPAPLHGGMTSTGGGPMMFTPDGRPDYSAREDYLMYRPWVLYFAALIVWSYGYALDGPLPTTRTPPSTPTEKHREMRDYLHRVGSVTAPDGLMAIRGRNQSAGVLMVVRDMFETTRWELLEEASRLLSNCVELLLGGLT